MDQRIKEKGLALLIVLGTLLIVVILANVILSIILSQSRLTHHQVSRIQAYYSAMAGVNYAYEMLRINDPNWPATGTYTRNLCNTNPACNINLPVGTVCNVNEANFPCSIQIVAITVGRPGSGINNTRQISAQATYTPI